VHTTRIQVPIVRGQLEEETVEQIVLIERVTTSVGLQGGARVVTAGSPFPDNQLYSLMPDGGGVVIVDRSIPDDLAAAHYSVSLVAATGDTVFSRSFAYEPVVLDDAAIRRAIEEAVSRISPETAPNAAVVEAAFRGADVLPASTAPLTDLVVTQDGSIWLRSEPAGNDSVQWRVLERSGESWEDVRLPAGQSVVAADGDVLVVTEVDEFDVPYLVRYRLLR
jgi:hypothetical protein